MPRLWESVLTRSQPENVTLEELLEVFADPSREILQTSWGNLSSEEAVASVGDAYRRSGPVFALSLARMQVFSQAQFQWTRGVDGTPADLFGSSDLRVIEQPWFGARTPALLSRMEADDTGAGNAFIRRIKRPGEDRLVRLRPTWVTILLGSQEDKDAPWEAADAEVIGYAYRPNGDAARTRVFDRDEVAHYMPIPDPTANYRGMSWVTPVLTGVKADEASEVHKGKFFDNAATPNLAIKFDPTATIDQVKAFKALLEGEHKGKFNAYKCLHPSTDVALWDGRRVRADEVKVGDHVVAWAGGRAVRGTVSAAEVQPPSPIVTVTTQRGRVIRTNDRHPFLLNGGEWVDAADLAPGDLLTTGLGWATDDVADTLTPHEAWVLGVVAGDGCTVSTTPVVSAWDQGIRSRLLVGHELRSTGKGHDYRLLGVRGLCVDAGLMGKRSWEKTIPASVMTGSAKVRAAYISGLIDTDGHVSDPARRASAEVGITSTSRELLTDAQHLLASLGVNTSVSLSMPSTRPGGGRDAWRLIALGNDQARRLHEVLDLACEAKERRLTTYAARPSKQDRSRVDRVASVVISAPEPTIGIEVADHHTHVTGGVVTHNTLYLGGGADPVAIGKDFKQMEFSATQAKGETRLASAAGVPPSWVGFSEGLGGSALNDGNYRAAQRRFADGTAQHLWEAAGTALEAILDAPRSRSGEPPARLVVDPRSVPFLREDIRDQAEARQKDAATMQNLIQAGFTPDSVVSAVKAGDWSKLKHSGLVSVQLQPPGADPAGSTPTEGGSDA